MKNKQVKYNTMRIALCSIVTALSLVFMLITSLVPIGTYALPCAAGVLVSLIVVEYGVKWALGVFFATAVLSAFLAGDKEAVIYFAALFGYYPILKNVLEKKIKNKPIRLIAKLAVFNAAAVGSFYAAVWLLSLPASEFTVFGFYVPWAFLIASNLFFVLYDYAVSVFVVQYVRRFQNTVFKNFHRQ